jgi:hypothetical protein
MQESEAAACRTALAAIVRRPISLLFFSTSGASPAWGKSSTPWTLSFVGGRLSRNLYKTAREFLKDINDMFNIAIRDCPRTLTGVAARALKRECHSVFEAHLFESVPAVIQLRAVQTAIERRANPPPVPPVRVDGLPGAEFFKLRGQPPDRRRLQRDLTAFVSPAVQGRIAAFLTKVQPEAVILFGTEIVFEIQLMSPETVAALHNFLGELFMKIVTGEIDPFEAAPPSWF